MAKADKRAKVVQTKTEPKRLAKEPSVSKETAAASSDDSQLAELKEQLLRVRADFENFKRRTVEERAEVLDLAKADLILQLLPVVDNFDRAAKHVPDEVSKSEWYQGFTAISKQFAKILESLGVERIDAVGQPFDPHRHEAVAHEPSDRYDKDAVSEEFEAGYAIGDRIVRPSKVKVSSGKENTNGS